MTPPSPWSGSSSTPARCRHPARRRAPPCRRREHGRSPPEREEGSVLLGLPRCGQRGQGPAVERVVGADDHVRPAPGPAPGQLQGALVGLGPRVREEDLPAGLAGPAVDQAVDGERHLGPQRVAVEIRDMGQRPGLGRHGIGHGRMGMAERHHGQTGDEVQVALARGVEEPRALAPHEGDRRLGVRAHEGTAIRCRAHGSTMVPTPESVNSSSSNAWGPAHRECGPGPHRPRTALAHASIFGFMPPTAPPPRRISSTTSRLA